MMEILHKLWDKFFGIVVLGLFTLLLFVGYIYDTSLYPDIQKDLTEYPMAKGMEHIGLLQFAPSYSWEDSPSILHWVGHFVSFEGWGLIPGIITIAVFFMWLTTLFSKDLKKE